MDYFIKTSVTNMSTSYCMMSEAYVDPIVIATAHPKRNRIEVYICETARKHGEKPDKLFNVRKPSRAVIEDLEERAIAHLNQQTVIVTGCSAKKLPNAIVPAEDLYRSSRISFCKRVAEEKALPLYIMSAEYGLVRSSDILASYDRIMDERRARELVDEVVRQLRHDRITSVVFFSAGVNRHYRQLLEAACVRLDIEFRAIGTGCMQGAKELPALLDVVTGVTKEGCELIAPVISKSAGSGQLRLF